MEIPKRLIMNKNLIGCVKLGIIIVNSYGVIYKSNQIAYELLGLDNITGRKIESVIPVLNIDRLRDMMIQKTCVTIERDSKHIQLQAQQIPLNYEHVDTLLFLMDVTNVEKLVEDYRKLEHSLNNTTDEQRELSDEIEDIREAVNRTEIRLINKAYKRYGNVRDAAKALGIDASTFVRKRNKYEKLGMLDET